MKKILSAVIATVLTAGFVFASGVENKTNLNPGYLRNPSRNTEAERPEASFYNIAGTAFMDNGLFIEAGNQFVKKEYGNELKTGSSLDYYSYDDSNVYLYPNADIVYRTGRMSFFGNFGVYAGGGSLSYADGTSATSLLFAGSAKKYAATAQKAAAAATQYAALAASESDPTQKAIYQKTAEAYQKGALDAGNAAKALSGAAAKGGHSLDVTSITYGGQLGCGWQILKNLSVAGAVRYVHGTQSMSLTSKYFTALGNGSDTVSYDANGYTVTGVGGIHYRPIKELDLAIQYQNKGAIKYEVKNVEGNLAGQFGIENGKRFHTDLPAALNLGAGYHITKDLYVSGSFNAYFNYFADQDSVLGETDYSNSYEGAVGIDYQATKWLGLSLGAQYGKQGIKDTSNSVFNPVLDSWCIGGGVEVKPINDLTFTLACLYANYTNADYYVESANTDGSVSRYQIELSKKVFNVAVGVTYHLPL